MNLIISAILLLISLNIYSNTLGEVDVVGGKIYLKDKKTNTSSNHYLVANCLNRNSDTKQCNKMNILKCDENFCLTFNSSLIIDTAIVDSNASLTSEQNVFRAVEKSVSFPFLGTTMLYLGLYSLLTHHSKDEISLGQKIVAYSTAVLFVPIDVVLFTGAKIIQGPITPIRLKQFKSSLLFLIEPMNLNKSRVYSSRKFNRTEETLSTLAQKTSSSVIKRFLGWQ